MNAKLVLLIGLIITAVSFAMLDRDWLKWVIDPIGPIEHPFAACVGLVGLAFCLFGARLLRRELRQRADDQRSP